MTGALTRSREHLGQHRRLIIGRSLATSLAGAVPLPLVDEWLSSSIARGTIRRIAEARGVDLDEDAERAIADGPESPPKFGELVGGGIAFKLVARQWRKLIWAVLAARRARAAARSFAVATLFDHYCARLHVGLGLDAERGAEVRALIDRALEDTPGGLSRHAFRRGLLAAMRTSARAPLELADFASRGLVTRLLESGDEGVATHEVDEALEAQLREEKSFLARSVAAVELQLASDENPYMGELLDCFEELVRAHRKDDA